MPRVLKQTDSSIPFHTPVYKWKKQIVEPSPSNIAATLGPRPGNTLKPPPNNFFLTKWAPLDQRSELSTASGREFQFYSVENQADEEPEVIAGIDLNEIITKPADKAAGTQPKAASTAGSPSKAVPVSPSKAVQPGSPSKAAPLSPSKAVSAPAPSSPTKAPVSGSPVKVQGSGSPVKAPGSPPKPVAGSPKDTIMKPASPFKAQ